MKTTRCSSLRCLAVCAAGLVYGCGDPAEGPPAGGNTETDTSADPDTATGTEPDTDTVSESEPDNGLTATYFNGRYFDERALERNDASVDFQWGTSSPDPRVNTDAFSVRWFGSVKPTSSETYTLITCTDDGVRLWIDNALVIDDWHNHAPRENATTISLDAGILYPLKLEYYDNSGGAVAQLYWSSHSQSTREIIPQSQLFTDYEEVDDCPDDPQKTEPLECGCGIPDEDSDADGALDCVDQCPDDPNKTEPLDCGCGKPEDSCGNEVNSNLQVKLDGKWRGVCCNDGDLEISNESCDWEEHGRVLETKDLRDGAYTELKCPENKQQPKDCSCRVPGERMHGIANGNRHVANSLSLPNGAPIYPNSGHETCIDLANGELRSRWTTDSCPDWRLVDFY